MLKSTPLKRVSFFLLSDIIIYLATLFLAYNLRFNFQIPIEFFPSFFLVFLSLTFFKISSLYLFKIYTVSWRFFSLNEMKKILYAHLIAYFIFVLLVYILPIYFMPFPRSVLIIDLFLSLIFIGTFRISKRLLLEGENDKTLKKTLLIGASPFTQLFFKQQKEFYISAIVDDNSSLIGTYLSNIKIQKFEDIETIIKTDKIETVIFTKELEGDILIELYNNLYSLNIFDIKLATLSDKQTILKNLSVEDLLARHPKDLDKSLIAEFIKDKIILITGAGGSIGSEISKQCEMFGASKLILLDHSEYNLYQISQNIVSVKTVLVMQNVKEKNLVAKTFLQYKPDIVIHAAAYKHVPLVEENIEEAILNNIIGTKNIIDLSIEYNVEKFILISTDKAVRPTNVMGTTKRICELYAQNVVAKDMEIVSVRFGNVLGSSGSVIPKFQSQIEKGENITVTHPDITRYFMLIEEACELVLQAGAIGKGGEIFILDMGEPVKIVDLAQKMIDLSGKKEIDIEFCGLRKGEKLYEELLINDTDMKTAYDSITVAKPTHYDLIQLNNDIMELISSKDKLAKLKEIVPEFNHQLNL